VLRNVALCLINDHKDVDHKYWYAPVSIKDLYLDIINLLANLLYELAVCIGCK
jgi:hypothetical protein